MTNIQDEVQKIHHQYGMSEVANYKIQLLCEKYAKEYHDSEVKKLNIPAVSGSSSPDDFWKQEYDEAVKEIGNLQDQLKDAESAIRDMENELRSRY